MISDFKSILDLIKTFPSEQECITRMEQIRWNGNVISPFDPESKIYKCAGNKYKCKNTGKYFNVKTNTIFDNTKIPLVKWFMALYVFSSHKKGISSHQLAKDIDVTQKTAWFILHRLRYAFNHPDFNIKFTDEVQVDETYMGGREANKHKKKKAGGTQGRNTTSKKPVIGLRDKDGHVYAQVVNDVGRKTIEDIIDKMVPAGATVYTDEWLSYNRLHEKYNHKRVNHGAKQFVNEMAHTNGVENFWSHLKRGIDSQYHWVSKHHLQSYVNEFVLRFNTRKKGTAERFDYILSNIVGRLTYDDLIDIKNAAHRVKNIKPTNPAIG
ncbi:ISXO2-like transposase domain-containing protein [Mucilaginibacter mallensis]|uniref:ISXO2-like transposase domain-containing protein n=1 Tax=Mucilaginibacter mallensis TaxID=652787 RepID=A0A1H1VH50_MUCMA|nr:IS1595 family transposase [Mucilaginibacter mallensis]SDS84178.1 ISXO2-like transposase domain-containing protein [Mucilaginibacter mallensis]